MQDNPGRDTDTDKTTIIGEQGSPFSKAISPYEIYLEKRRLKETALFTKLSVILSVLFVLGLILASGLLPIPFINNFSEKIHYAGVGDIPCPVDSTPLNPEKIKLSVQNGTEINKLASKTGSSLKALKFQVTKTGNASNNDHEESALVLTPANQIDSAFTVALALPNSTVRVAPIKEITVILGQGFKAPIREEEFKELIKKPLQAPKDCLPVE